MMGLIFKVLWKIYKTPLILLHAAHLKILLTGVRPAVDLSWKALMYMVQIPSQNSARKVIFYASTVGSLGPPSLWASMGVKV